VDTQQLTATTAFECPLCLHEIKANEREKAAEYEVTILVDPGQDAVRYARPENCRPGYAPTVDAVETIKPVGKPCSHYSTEELDETLEEAAREAFRLGRFD